MDPLNSPGYCIFVGINWHHLKFSQRICQIWLIDHLWLMLEVRDLKMMVSGVPVHFIHRCSTLSAPLRSFLGLIWLCWILELRTFSRLLQKYDFWSNFVVVGLGGRIQLLWKVTGTSGKRSRDDCTCVVSRLMEFPWCFPQRAICLRGWPRYQAWPLPSSGEPAERPQRWQGWQEWARC